MSIPPTLLVLMPLLEIKPLTMEKMGVSEGETPPQKLRKNANFDLNLQNLVHIFCQHFTEMHYSFPMKYWLLYYVYSSHLSILL